MHKQLAWIVVALFIALFPIATLAQQSPAALSGFSPDELFAIEDNRSLLLDDATVFRLVNRVKQSSQSSLRKFSNYTRNVELDEVISDPRDFRCYVFDFTGHVKSVNSYVNSASDGTANVRNFDIVRLETENDGECLVVVADDGIPNRWPTKKLLHERAEFTGFFAANYDLNHDLPEVDPKKIINVTGLEATSCPVFVTNRIRWFPESENDLFEVSESELLLAKHGVDIGQFDIIRKNASGRLRSEDSESFYQFLAATQNIDESLFPNQTADFKDCLQFPRKFQGSPVSVEGQVRQVSKVQISDELVIEKLGQNHYFQLMVFAPLDTHKIVIHRANSNDQQKPDNAISHENRFPVTVCVAHLPCAATEMAKKQVSVSGFFFKRWNYENELSIADPAMPQQLSPLIIGSMPRIVQPPKNPLDLLVTAAFIVGAVGMVCLFWLFGPGDRRRRKDLNQRNRELPEKIEFLERDLL